jgi:hypothetical protein
MHSKNITALYKIIQIPIAMGIMGKTGLGHHKNFNSDTSKKTRT